MNNQKELASIDVSDLVTLAAELRQLPELMRSKLVRGACKAAMSELRDECVRRAPILERKLFPSDKVPPGNLKKAIYSMRVKEDCTFNVEVWKVDVRKWAGTWKHKRNQGRDSNEKGAGYAGFIEYGHYARTPAPVPTDSRKLHARRDAFQATGLAAWVPAHPFMRPAFDAMKPRFGQIMGDYINRNLPEQLATFKIMKQLGA